jgi:hypothetical protein
MPRPLLLHRPAGLYVRFRVPSDLRELVGSRFLVRPLRQPVGQAARLAAAVLDMALSAAFGRMRRGNSVARHCVTADAPEQANIAIGNGKCVF